MQGSTSTLGAVQRSPSPLDRLRRIPIIYIVLLIVLILIGLRNPNFYQPLALLAFLKRNAAIVLVTMGQMAVITAGELDLGVVSVPQAQCRHCFSHDGANGCDHSG